MWKRVCEMTSAMRCARNNLCKNAGPWVQAQKHFSRKFCCFWHSWKDNLLWCVFTAENFCARMFVWGRLAFILCLRCTRLQSLGVFLRRVYMCLFLSLLLLDRISQPGFWNVNFLVNKHFYYYVSTRFSRQKIELSFSCVLFVCKLCTTIHLRCHTFEWLALHSVTLLASYDACMSSLATTVACRNPDALLIYWTV